MKLLAAVLLPASLFAALLLGPDDRANSAEAPALPVEFQFIPADAAFFVHADAAKLWSGTLGQSLRTADAKTFDELASTVKKLFGANPDSLKSIALYFPKLKGPQDTNEFGAILTFNTAFDKAQLLSGFQSLLPKGTKASIETPTDRIAVLLAGLDRGIYGKPQPAGKTGPLSGAIREAAAGKHLLAAAANLANFPDEIRGDDLPADFRPFQPLLRADTIAATIDLDKELTVDVRVKAATPPRAKDAEKALGFLAALLQQTLEGGVKELAAETQKDPALKDVVTIMTRLQAGLKDAKYSTEGDVTRVTAKVAADLPYAGAFLAAKRKVMESASRSQSSNNLKQILVAFHNYASANDAFPPAAVCDKTGKPILSWRVLILPYLEQDNLYKEFKLDEPWDSDHNKKLIAKMPKTYAVPTPTSAKANETHYRAFVGNGAAFDYIKGAKLPADFPDGTSNTILVVTAKDAVIWTKPDELDFDPDKDMTKLLGLFPGDGCIVGFADGSVRTLNKKISKVTLHGAITRGGGEVLGEDF